MENDLERSVRLLEDALHTPTKGLFKIPTPGGKQSKRYVSNDFNFTMDTAILENTVAMHHNTISILMDTDKTVTGSIIQSGTPWTNAVENLYTEFASSLQTSSSGLDMLEIAGDLATCCSDVLFTVKTLKSKVHCDEIREEKWLEAERNNWRLLFVLYQDRLQAEDDVDMETYNGQSEKRCVDHLFKTDNLIRESQLVVDWLERNAAERGTEVITQPNFTYGWEHTLHEISSPENIAFRSCHTIIDEIHPDAPHVTKGKHLHHLDTANDKKLCQNVFMYIRSGRLEEAQELCCNCGHPWRAAILTGWQLWHDPNEDSEAFDECASYEGNYNRDLWKSNALEYTRDPTLNRFEKATVGSLCGNLEAILPLCETWEDFLWAYMKTVIDIRVESEIRDTIIRDYEPLPEEYWQQKMSITKIFQLLESADSKLSIEAKQRNCIIQKHLILDEIPSLVELLAQWTEDPDTTTQEMRFYAHLVLFLEIFGFVGDKALCEKILEEYIQRLTSMNLTDLVAFYCSKIRKPKQIVLYAQHCESITDNEARKSALSFAENNELDLFSITKRIVESVCNKSDHFEPLSNLSKKLTPLDELKISSLDWLTFYEEQRLDALEYTNHLIYKFLTFGKLEGAQLAVNKIPRSCIDSIKNDDDRSDEAEKVLKNFLSFKSYLDAHEAFNDWFKQFSNKPAAPSTLSDNAQFTEKVAFKQKTDQYAAELERWKLTTAHMAKTAKTYLYNVLLFPEGWLYEDETASYLRSKCIPEVVLLLYSLLKESNWHEEAVQLVDVLASETHKLYKIYSKDKLGEIMEKICECSVALLNAKKDPWGNPHSA